MAVTPIKPVNGLLLPSIAKMAKRHASWIAAEQPRGPLRLGGFCNGGLIAFEAARELAALGRDVECVVLIDPPKFSFRPLRRRLYSWLSGAMLLCVGENTALDRGLNRAILWTGHRGAMRLLSTVGPTERQGSPAGADRGASLRYTGLATRIERQWRRAVQVHVPKPVPAPVIFFSAQHDGEPWRNLAPEIEIVRLDCDHMGCVTTHLDRVAGQLRALLEKRSGCAGEETAHATGD